ALRLLLSDLRLDCDYEREREFFIRLPRRGLVLLSVGGSGQADEGKGSSRRQIPRNRVVQRRNVLNKRLPFPNLLALFSHSYLVANINRSGHERGLANGENRFALVNHHAHSLLYLS